MAIRDKADSKPKSKSEANIQTEIAIARYETFRKQQVSKPDKSPGR